MKIEVIPYSIGWPTAFEREKSALLNAAEGIAVNIHHIGSTAVEGLASKPVIDIMLEVASLEGLDACNEKIEALGYEALGEFGIVGRRYFRKGRYDRTHQIHAFRTSDANINRHLAFRDYLNHHPDFRDEYARLKFQVAAACNDSIDRYCEGKCEFIRIHEARALEWVKI